MTVSSFLTGSHDDCACREPTECYEGYANTPPGWIWRNDEADGALRLTPEDAWRRQGKLGPSASLATAEGVRASGRRRYAAVRNDTASGSAGSCDGAIAADLELAAAGDVMGLPPASFQQIGRFENMCGAPLPRDYVEFLLAGDVAPVMARFFDAPVGGPLGETLQGFVLHGFLGFDMRPATRNLDYALLMYAGGAPAGVIPIAGNGAGDYVCLDLRGGGTERRCPVALWRIGHFWRTGEWREQDFSLLAGSFTEFMDGLRTEPDALRRGVMGRAAARSGGPGAGLVAASARYGAPLFRNRSA